MHHLYESGLMSLLDTFKPLYAFYIKETSKIFITYYKIIKIIALTTISQKSYVVH